MNIAHKVRQELQGVFMLCGGQTRGGEPTWIKNKNNNNETIIKKKRLIFEHNVFDKPNQYSLW